jgi:hypothetical protein
MYLIGVVKLFVVRLIRTTGIYFGFLATFGDLGWGKAEGRGQKAEVRRKEEGNNRFKL